jgi:hypothetical protein
MSTNQLNLLFNELKFSRKNSVEDDEEGEGTASMMISGL